MGNHTRNGCNHQAVGRRHVNGRANGRVPQRLAGRIDHGSQAGDDDADGPIDEADESFLVTGHREADPSDEMDMVSHKENGAADLSWQNWAKSEAYGLIHRQGSPDVPGNWRLAVPRWLLCYFNSPVKALAFTVILYWYGLDKHGKPRLRWRDKQRSLVLAKTYQELADEVGLRGSRRIERLLKDFRDKHRPLDYEPHGIGAGKKTYIWLNPKGILKAYRLGSKRAEQIEANRHDKSGGSKRAK